MPSSKDRIDGPNEMIDLHSHILPKLDDGSRSVGESIGMCRISYRDGVRTIVATPHTLTEPYQNDRVTILSKVRELNGMIGRFGTQNLAFGVKNPKSEKSHHFQSEICNLKSEISLHSALEILPGSDVRLCEEILPYVDQGKVATIGDAERFMIVEFPFYSIPYRAEDILFGLMARGITPVISHPERNVEIEQRPERYYEMIRMGCLGQVTAMSLTGGFGSQIRRFAGKLLRRRLIHAIASDAHGIDGRPPGLMAAVREAGKIVGRAEAIKLVTEYPRAIIQGRRPNVPEPLSL